MRSEILQTEYDYRHHVYLDQKLTILEAVY